MPENSQFDNEPLAEIEPQPERELGRVSCALMGLGWGVATYEGGVALTNFVLHNASTGDYSLKNQLIGLGIFGIGGATLMGRFIHSKVNGPE